MLNRTVALVGVPMDLGGGRRGVDMGPSALRIAGIEEAVRSLGLAFEDRGNVPVREPRSRVEPEDPKARFLPEIADCCRHLRAKVEGVLADGAFPLVVGGDHSIAVGTVAAISSHYHRQQKKIGLIWFDAHGDMNTPETSVSGNIHGMPLACVLGRGAPELTKLGERFPMVDVEKAVLVGVRSLDAREKDEIRAAGLHVYTARDIDMHGIHKVMKLAIEIASTGTAGFHLTFDMDGTDPSVAPGVGTPVPGGTTFRESHLIMEHAAESGKLLGLEVTEINPILDNQNTTARVAVDLVLSALGKAVL
ncbi:MAG: arginase [Planctomycetes bacterium]|nr:arginase [Planctomycetota bacterium]